MAGINRTNLSDGLRKLLAGSLLLLLAVIISGCSTPRKVGELVDLSPPNTEINIIPLPTLIMPTNNGHFLFSPETKIVATDEAGIKASTALNNLLMERYGLKLELSDDASLPNAIIFSSTAVGEDQLSRDEGYFLKIEPGSVQINGSERGMFYASQSLIQLLPLDFSGRAKIRSAEILDAPRFRYRGMHLDVARHFMPVEFVKKYIRLISRYKYNYFHWHLTDDQGWRIEIKKYPRLTEVGSRRRETVVGKSYQPYIGDNFPVAGFYTQEEIRDIVEYARARYVTIIPEIELPGHSSSALASYPKLGCRKNYPYKVQTTWGAFPEIYCPTEETFQFIEGVLGEVLDLFPDSPYIHIGGDEVMTDSWRSSPEVRELMRTKGFSSDREVVKWFIHRVENFVNSKGKRIIGWDDILDAEVATSATVMSWHSVEDGIKAAKRRHEVIMAPTNFTYFDHPQADARMEPLSLGDPVTLEKVYNFEPVPAALREEDARYIIGGEGCLWTEFLKRPENIEYMMFPRALALAEVLWSKREHRNFNAFSKRLYREFANLDRENVNYRIPEPHGFGDWKQIAREKVLIDLSTPIPNGRIYYTFNGKNPNESSSLYTFPFVINIKPNEPLNFKARVLTSAGRESTIFIARYTSGLK